MHALMIDPHHSRDRDDAVTVTPLNTGWEATVYVANVADAVALGSDIDSDAADRGRTVYGPARRRSMLGIATEAACTLRPDRAQSVMAIVMTFDADGTRLPGSRIERRLVPAQTFLPVDHSAAVQALHDPTDPLHRDVTNAAELARLLASRRAAAGALVVYDSSRAVMTTEDGRLIAVDAGTAQAHLIVQELMVAANRAVAEWAIDRQLPILFRNHRRSPVAPASSDRAAEVMAILDSPTAVFDVAALAERVNLTVTKAVYEPTVDGHYGLHVPAYTHATSPLRRYADLVTQRIILAAVDGKESPYETDELQPVADMIEAATAEADNVRVSAQKASAKRLAAKAIADGALSDLDDKAFTRALKLALSFAPAASVVQELSRRAREGILTAGQAGLVFTSEVPEWTPVLGSTLESLMRSSPSAAMSVWSVRTQLLGLRPDVLSLSHSQFGPPHEPVFAARAASDGFFSPWMTAGSKRIAEQQAIWHVLLVLTGRADSADASEHPPAPEPERDEPVDAPEMDPLLHGEAIPDRIWSTMLGETVSTQEKKMRSARKNPVGWLNSLMSSAGCAPPAIGQVRTGPAHAPVFTVSIAVGPVLGTASGPTVKSARVAAADDAVVQLFQSASIRFAMKGVLP